jgi:hypothetical protein
VTGQVLANEVPMVSGWLYATMLNDATLVGLGVTDDKVWEYKAPDDVNGWYIAYQQIEAAGDVRGLGNTRLFTKLRYLIRVVDRGADWGHGPVANRIDQLFDGNAEVVRITQPVLGWIEGSTRISPFDQSETVSGVEYRHVGGIYEIAAIAGE